MYRALTAFAGLASIASAAAADEPVKFRVVDGNGIPDSLTGRRGDPVAGARVAADRRLGNCLACHRMPIPDEPVPGDMGPDLTAVGARLTEAELRLRVVDPKMLDAATAMPAFYRVDGLRRVRHDLAGKPVLSAEQVEDVVAFLKTLTGAGSAPMETKQ